MADQQVANRVAGIRRPPVRQFLVLMCGAGFAMSLTAPLEVLFARSIHYSPAMLGGFMLTSTLGVIVVDVFGTRLVPSMDGRTSVTTGLALFGLACAGMAVAWNYPVMTAVRLLQGFGAGLMLGGALQAAVRVTPADSARAIGRFNASFLLGGAIGSPGGLLIVAVVKGVAGYREAFTMTGLLALVLAFVVRLALPELQAPRGAGRPRLGLPRLDRSRGTFSGLAIAMLGDFLRGGVLFTALPLTGAARGFPTITIGLAIVFMSLLEILVLTVSPRLLWRIGLVRLLSGALALGSGCAAVLAVSSSPGVYLVVSALFGVALAGMTLGLPLIAVGLVGESSAGLARFRISAGIGMLAGSAGCALLGSWLGPRPLFWAVTAVLASGIVITRDLAQRFATS